MACIQHTVLNTVKKEIQKRLKTELCNITLLNIISVSYKKSSIPQFVHRTEASLVYLSNHKKSKIDIRGTVCLQSLVSSPS